MTCLLQNKKVKELKCEMYYRHNVYDCYGDVLSYEHVQEMGDFFEILLWLNENKILSILFDLDGYVVGLELREDKRKNSVSLMRRNYNGAFYVFPKNCLNIANNTINYYLDYYNNYVVINDEYAKQLMNEIYQIVKVVHTLTNNVLFLELLDKILLHDVIDLFDGDFYKKQGYATQLSVLPPNVRPDNNSHYIIIQIVSGCKIMAKRKKACGFCSSYEMKYHEYTKDELESHIKCLQENNPCITKRADSAFLSDGDPLAAISILLHIEIIKEKLPNIKNFESFISTETILTMAPYKWKALLKMGLQKVYWGVESADDVTLRIIDKPHNSKMIYEARNILEEQGVSYDIIVMCGIGLISKANRTMEEVVENAHVEKTAGFINSSNCSSVFISKLQIVTNSALARKVNSDIFPFTEDEMELQYRSLINKIEKNVRGSYGNQFVVEKVD